MIRMEGSQGIMVTGWSHRPQSRFWIITMFLTPSVMGHPAPSVQATGDLSWMLNGHMCLSQNSPTIFHFPRLWKEWRTVGGTIYVGNYQIKLIGICIGCLMQHFVRGVYRSFPAQHTKTVFIIEV